MSDKPSEDECVIHEHPVPPQELARYRSNPDVDAELDVVNYIHGQAQDETVQHVERVKTEYVMGDAYEVWDVVTDKNRWWVISSPMNLYLQKYFPSLDYTISFHVGLMMRVRSNQRGPDSSDPQPFDEVSRRHEQAHDLQVRAVESEDYQAVGMQLRECLLALIAVMQRRVEIHEGVDNPQAANFIGWAEILMNQLCPGEANKTLRQYLKGASEKTWQLVSWLTHDRHANKTASSIALHAVDVLIGHYVLLLSRDRTDSTEKCPLCSSRDIRTHFDIGIEPDGAYYDTCGACRWSSHPEYGLETQEGEGPPSRLEA